MSRPHSLLILPGSSEESLMTSERKKKKKKSGLFSRFAASVSNLAHHSPGRRHANVQTDSPSTQHKHTQTDDDWQLAKPATSIPEHAELYDNSQQDVELQEAVHVDNPRSAVDMPQTADIPTDDMPFIDNVQTDTESMDIVVDHVPVPVHTVLSVLPPALKMERTDSPIRHSPKTVRFNDDGRWSEDRSEGRRSADLSEGRRSVDLSEGRRSIEGSVIDDDPEKLPQHDDERRLLQGDQELPTHEDQAQKKPRPVSECDLQDLDNLLKNLDIYRTDFQDCNGGTVAVSPIPSPSEVVGVPVDLAPTSSLLPSPPAFFLRDMATAKDSGLHSEGNRPENDGFEFHPPPVSSQKSPPLNGHIAEGSVLLEERVTRSPGEVVCERVYGLPCREVVREEVRTTRFTPAPPKYEGIGPTDPDGLPLAPRQMVKKEHDWYKSMFKTLHPAEEDDDEQVVVRYSCSPEPEIRSIEQSRVYHPSPRKEHLFPSTQNNTASPSPPPSATSRISPINQGSNSPMGRRRPRATALFAFQARQNKELALSKGDVVSVCRRVDAHWFEGEYNGRKGIFPANHVKVLFPDQAMCGRILHDFQAHSPLELSVRKGELVRVERCSADSDWWAVRTDETGKRGLLPAAHIHLLEEAAPALEEKEVRKKENTLIEPIMCVALYAYSPAHPDELELEAGDMVRVVERCGDGWCAGTSTRTHATGLFPGNYVEPLVQQEN